MQAYICCIFSDFISGCKKSEPSLSLQVFEDENEAAKYCDLLQGGGKGCEGVAEIEASSVRNRATFRTGTVLILYNKEFPKLSTGI
jgi:hypothetical protein